MPVHSKRKLHLRDSAVVAEKICRKYLYDHMDHTYARGSKIKSKNKLHNTVLLQKHEETETTTSLRNVPLSQANCMSNDQTNDLDATIPYYELSDYLQSTENGDVEKQMTEMTPKQPGNYTYTSTPIGKITSAETGHCDNIKSLSPVSLRSEGTSQINADCSSETTMDSTIPYAFSCSGRKNSQDMIKEDNSAQNNTILRYDVEFDTNTTIPYMYCENSQHSTTGTCYITDTLNTVVERNSVFEINGHIFSKVEVPGDGDCFFHSIGILFHGNLERSTNYRHEVCNYIIENWDVWNERANLHHSLRNNSPDEYFTEFIDKKAWATRCEVEAIANLLDVNLRVIIKGTRYDNDKKRTINMYTIDNLIGSQSSDRTFHLLLCNSHYSALVEQNSFPLNAQNVLANPIEQANDNMLSIVSPNVSPYHSGIQRSSTDISDIQEISSDTILKESVVNNKQNSTSKISKIDPSVLKTALKSVNNFEIEQMAYTFQLCSVCNERRLGTKSSSKTICKRCSKDKSDIKMFSKENNMDPGEVPQELQNLSVIEQQLICRTAPTISIHLLKHGGLASSGHCVTFPQEINEPAQIFPKLPEEIKVIRVRKKGRNDSSKDFLVRRYAVQNALQWLKANNPCYSDIIISKSRLDQLPLNGEINGLQTIEYENDETDATLKDLGPAADQLQPADIQDQDTTSGVLLPDPKLNINNRVEQAVKDVIGENYDAVTSNRDRITLPWPTRQNEPISEFSTNHFFTLAFPTLFPHGTGDFRINRPRTCESMADWAEHLLWYKDGRFAKHKFFKFIVHNIISRKRTLENSKYIVKQLLGDEHMTVEELKTILQNQDESVFRKIMYFSANLRGTSQYWAQRSKELRSLIQFNINEGKGLPSFFVTGSCAEFYFRPLRRLLEIYTKETEGVEIQLEDKNQLYETLQKNSHIVGKYFDMRTQSYFNKVMNPVFGIDTFWYRYEFAKSRGMIHWHGLTWRKDREPHNLLYNAVQENLNDKETAAELAAWAQSLFGMTAKHPAGSDEDGNPRKDLWPPPEGHAPAPPEDKNPLTKLLMDVSKDQESLLEDHLLLSNRINLHRCSSYCLRKPRNPRQYQKGEQVCRMEFGTSCNPGKSLRSEPALVRDKNGSLRLELARDHPNIVQHSQIHTQAWRANGDISIIVSKSNPENPSVDEILATEKYVSGYACKGNEPTGALSDLYNNLLNSSDESNNVTAKSICTKLLMNTIKRDISATEASYEVSSLPLYRCSKSFQYISLSGSRVLENTGSTATRKTPLDKYLSRNESDRSSWYNFICKTGKVPVVHGNTEATWPLNFDYCRTMLLLHWPNWRSINDIVPDNSSWVDQMSVFLLSDTCPNFVKAQVERAKQQHEKRTAVDYDSDEETCSPVEQPEWIDAIQPNAVYDDFSSEFQFWDGGPNHDWSCTRYTCQKEPAVWWNDIKESAASTSESNHPAVDPGSLNEDQKFAYNLVMHTLTSSEQNVKPLRMVVTGAAGSGKSYLIKCIVNAVRNHFRQDDAVQVLCPTGNSANLISGVTLHSFLHIPIGSKATKEMKPPDGLTGQSLQQKCKNVKCLLIDERSLIGCNTLGWMEFHCSCGVNNENETTANWGEIPIVVFFGDDVQLPPVCDSPLYLSKGKTPSAIHGSLVWQTFDTVVHLKSVIRQNSDQRQLKETLDSFRNYSVSKEQAQWLQQFQKDNLVRRHGQDLLTRMKEKSLFVFPNHEEEWNHNKKKLLEKNEIFPIAKVAATNRGLHSSSSSSDKSGGLIRTLYICKEARVMLTCNLNVKFGLYNGAVGTVKEIIFAKDRSPQTDQPEIVLVNFPKYTGPPYLQEYPKLVPVTPIERRLDCNCCKRIQVPLRLGWGTTIHRCQGMTIGSGEINRYIVINPGSKSFESRNPGALYVALSRAKTAGGPNEDPDFCWDPNILVNEDRLCHKVDTSLTRARASEIDRLSSLSRKTKERYRHLLDVTEE